MIHDFDMARFLIGDEIVEITATGSVLIDDAIGAAGDVGTAIATLRSRDGRLARVSNSRVPLSAMTSESRCMAPSAWSRRAIPWRRRSRGPAGGVR